MYTKKIITLTLISAMTSTLFLGCGTKEANIPFTDYNFETTYQEITDDLGTPVEEAASYLGTSYCYDSDYLSDASEVRYTFDEDGNMASITWLLESSDSEEITDCYNDIHSELVNTYGETKEATSDTTQLSDIWRLETGNITLVAVISTEYNGIMYTYLSPANSTLETK